VRCGRRFLALFRLFLLSAIAIGILCRESAQGWEINWNSNIWPGTAPVLTQTYSASFDPAASGMFYYDPDYAGMGQIRITISGVNGGADAAHWQNGTPLVDSTLTGGASGNSLQLQLDWANNSQGITVKVEFLNYATPFTSGVTNVHYDLFDIDKFKKNDPSYIDEISNIYGQLGSGPQIAPSITFTKNGSTAVSGSGLSQVIDGTDASKPDKDDGNATIDFAGDTIDKYSFGYGNAPGANADPTVQDLGLGNISFSHARRFPEVGTSIAAMLVCAGSAMLQILRRK
jgi:hypothetical protein